MNSMDEQILRVDNEYRRDNNVLKTKLEWLNDNQKKEEWECNVKYDELVREYKKDQPQEYILFSGGLREALKFGVAVGMYAWFGTSVISCFTNCDDWWHCDEFWMESWYQLHVIIPTLIIIVIGFLLGLYTNRSNNKTYRNVENSVNELERERKRELDKLQQKYNAKRQQIGAQYAENERKYDTKKQEIVAQYNQNRQKYLQQLRNSNNTIKLKQQVMVDFERIYEMIDKSIHIKDILFDFYMTVNQEDIRVSGIKGQSRLHDMGYIYQRLQMKNLENIEQCEALAEVLSEEMDFMIKEHYKQAVTDVKCNGVVVHIVFVEPNMNYKGLEDWK